MKLTALTVTTAAALAAMPAQAWWDNGHMLVGEIASQLMDPADVATIEKVLSKWDDEFPGTSKIATASIWPDLVKCNTKSAFCDTLALPSVPAMDKWHYVNLPLFTNGARWGNAEPDLTLFAQSWGGDAGDVVDQFIRTFNTSNSVWSVNLALRQVIHILGDVHNPMHAVGAVNENNPKGDSGGNNFTFAAPCVGTNLHALYDSAGGDLINNWGEKYPLWDELKKNATDLIASLAIIEDGVDMKSIQSLSYAEFSNAFTRGSYFKKFILESYTVASKFVYPALDLTPVAGTRNVKCPPNWYVLWATQISKFRIALAGKRLSVVLTQVAKHLRTKAKFA